MKKISSLFFTCMTAFANENWIEIKPMNQMQTKETNISKDINLSQIEPINKIMKNATIIKQLIDATNKKEKPTNEKNWFLLK